MIYSISGSREVNVEDLHLIKTKILSLTDATKILFGGALGIDTITLNYASELLKGVQFEVVVPQTLFCQPKFAVLTIKKSKASVIELKNIICPSDGFESYKIRNKYLVDNSDHLIAFWNGKSSGTYHTINYAASISKPTTIINLK